MMKSERKTRVTPHLKSRKMKEYRIAFTCINCIIVINIKKINEIVLPMSMIFLLSYFLAINGAAK